MTSFQTCSPGPASLALKSLFSSGKIEAQGSQSAWPGPQEGGDPEKHRKAPNQQEHMESHEAGDHGGYFRLGGKTRLYVLLVGAMPEVGQ